METCSCGADPTATNEIKQGAAGGFVEAAVDEVGTELAKALFLGDGVAADGDLSSDDQSDERAIAVTRVRERMRHDAFVKCVGVNVNDVL